jgi:hypothetical protein
MARRFIRWKNRKSVITKESFVTVIPLSQIIRDLSHQTPPCRPDISGTYRSKTFSFTVTTMKCIHRAWSAAVLALALPLLLFQDVIVYAQSMPNFVNTVTDEESLDNLLESYGDDRKIFLRIDTDVPSGKAICEVSDDQSVSTVKSIYSMCGTFERASVLNQSCFPLFSHVIRNLTTLGFSFRP